MKEREPKMWGFPRTDEPEEAMMAEVQVEVILNGWMLMTGWGDGGKLA